MAGRPKDPTINKKIYQEIERLLQKDTLDQITIDQVAENTGVSKATIYRRWSDKSSIIISMFVEQFEIFEPHYHSLFEDLYQFSVKVMNIYKTTIGQAVMEILTSNQKSQAKTLFMDKYFNSNRAILKKIITPHINEEDQDIFIDLIFSPIYFNILIKPEVLDEDYIKQILNKVLTAYHIEK